MNRTVFILVALFFVPITAFGESVSWGTNFPQLYQMHTVNQAATSGKCLPTMKNGYARVTYNVRATNATTGEPVCNTTITKGTPILLQFVPHVFSDVYWFATGSLWDSPYGDWGVNAQTPYVINSTPSFCIAKNYYSSVDVPRYASLTINPPQKMISNLNGLVCDSPDENGSVLCTARTVGSFGPLFNFEATYGHMYGAFSSTKNIDSKTKEILPGKESACGVYTKNGRIRFSTVRSASKDAGGTGWSTCSGEKPFVLDVPEQHISCPITIIDAPGNPPDDPNISSVSGQCRTGNAFMVELSSTDPDDDQVRFLVDWDDDFLVDESIPGSTTSSSPSYTDSGSIITTSRIFPTAGVKTINVKAQDGTKLFSNNWSTLTFDCGELLEDDELLMGANTGANSDTSGSGGDGYISSEIEDMSIRAIPSLVRKGGKSSIHWSSSGMVSCTVTGTNGDGCVTAGSTGCAGWDTLDSPVAVGKETSPIQSRIVYTLKCINVLGETKTKKASVGIRPTWLEL